MYVQENNQFIHKKTHTQIPYFEGDFWPNVLEESIKELDQEEEEKKKREEAEAAAAEQASVEEIVEGEAENPVSL